MNATELAWFKSSYSGTQGDSCVEVAWSKSSYSSPQGDDCVEVAWSKSSHSSPPTHVHVRDSKAPARPRLTLSPAAWTAFVSLAAARP